MRVLLTGVSGYIGKNLYESLRHEHELVVLSQYEQPYDDIIWAQGDIFNLQDVSTVMADIDIAIYFLDPTKRSSKTMEANFKDMNALAADNYGRAAQANDVNEIIYISGAVEDDETLNILRSYKTPVRTTEVAIKRKGMLARFQSARTDDVRIIRRFDIPKSWTLEKFTAHYFEYYKNVLPGLSNVTIEDEDYILQGMNRDLIKLHRRTALSNNDRQVFDIRGGKLAVVHLEQQGQLEFRRMLGTEEIMVCIHQYEPSQSWLFYQLLQAPFHALTMRIFEVDMRIEKFNEEQKR
ncbi:NAD-dependent epimerase/dehydratase family protein [Macrococcus hajekii]|uniref:NAD-dependent epimerase/dehydratase family protein n=1 Tax=Macrococcus hajekii TaxID=198482 RepID=A0A4R6BJ02_9STAP|nr:NAD-dependent epimerase/dehydratase family protein [Macrococcus hajekii]TDM01578.1 NAD-dependent epimerase/dehydratase family protein [Macrococcus hajekii]GGB01170.1 3-beta hydroxysteroid dehydrogenase [Macrococcus hajekii]